MILNLDDLSPSATYHLITQTVIPRPIAWVLTQNSDGKTHNLAPFSYFNAVASDPPLLMISCVPKPDGSLKDTVVNTLREKQLVIHIPSTSQLQAVEDSAEPLAYGESEIPLTGLTLCDFEQANPQGIKRLAEAPIAFACELYQTETLGNAPQTLLFAEVKSVYIDEAAVRTDGKRISVSADAVEALARLGGRQFMVHGTTQLPETK